MFVVTRLAAMASAMNIAKRIPLIKFPNRKAGSAGQAQPQGNALLVHDCWLVGWMDPRVSCNVSLLWLEMQDWKSGQWVKAAEGCSKYVMSSVIFVLNLHFYFHVFESTR